MHERAKLIKNNKLIQENPSANTSENTKRLAKLTT